MTEINGYKQIPSFPMYYMNEEREIRRVRANGTLKKPMTAFTSRTSKVLRVELITTATHKTRVRVDSLYTEVFGDNGLPPIEPNSREDWFEWEYISPLNPNIPEHISPKGRGHWRLKEKVG